MIRTASVALGGALVGALVTWWVATPNGESGHDPASLAARSQPDVVAAADRLSEVEQLRAELEIEREMRRQLAAEMQQARQARTRPARDAVDEDAQAQTGVGVPQPSRTAPNPHSAADGAWFSSSDLRALGLDDREIERIQEAWDRYEMARIELRHRLLREGQQADKKRHAREARALELSTQEELGDDRYDALLYASGRENRVILTEILESSPAAAAGLASGDELIQYDGQRIFRPYEVVQLTSTGERGDWIGVVVKRGGAVQRYHVQRGPLGVRLGTDRRVPYLE